MNECEQAERLSAYHDGELSGAARTEVEQHLRRCPACAAELNRLGRLSQLFSAAAEPRVPPEVLERLHAAVDVLPLAEIGRLARIVAAIAAAILLVSSVWLLRAGGAGEPKDQIPVWETVAVVRQEVPVSAPEEQLAQWIVQDLSRKNGHDKN